MPTSSIFYNFTIADEIEAERFVDVLDMVAQQPPWRPQSEPDPLIRDPEKIREICYKALAVHNAKLKESSGTSDKGG